MLAALFDHWNKVVLGIYSQADSIYEAVDVIVAVFYSDVVRIPEQIIASIGIQLAGNQDSPEYPVFKNIYIPFDERSYLLCPDMLILFVDFMILDGLSKHISDNHG